MASIELVSYKCIGPIRLLVAFIIIYFQFIQLCEVYGLENHGHSPPQFADEATDMFFFFKKIALFRICMFYKILITPILIQGTIYCIAT